MLKIQKGLSYFEIIKPIPPIAWLPIIVIWFGIGEFPKVLLVIIRALMPIVVNTYTGIKMADKEIELIEPVEGDSVWKDFLEEKGEGIHHLKYEVESINDTMKFFKEQGIECPQYGSAVGPNKGRTWAYFDTVDQLGYVIEVFNRKIGEKVED